MGEHVEPGDDAGDDGEDEEDDEDRAVDHLGIGGCRKTRLVGNHAEDDADQGDRDRGSNAVPAEARRKPGDHRLRQHLPGDGAHLRVEAGVRLAHVVAAAVERTAERADRRGIGGTPGHVLGLERMLADGAGDGAGGFPAAAGLAGKIEASAGGERDCRRKKKGHKRQVGGERGHHRPEQAEMGGESYARRSGHRPKADRIDVIQVGALELDAGRREAERLVNEEVRRNCAEPRHGNDREDAKGRFQQPVDAELHQQKRDRDVEDQPYDPPGMAVGQPGKEVRPGERAGVGIHHVDLQLRHDHEGCHQQEGRRLVRDHVAESDEIHVRRIGRVTDRDTGREGQDGEKRACQELRDANHDPARSGEEHRQPMAPLTLPFRGKEAEEVHLLADLRHQRQDHGRGGAEFQKVEGGRPAHFSIGMADAGKGAPEIELLPVEEGDEQEWKDVEDDPEGLGYQLEARDQPHAVDHQGDDHDGTDDVADPGRDAEGELERAGHDRRFDRKQHEGEGRIDQRRDRRADIAEARAPGQKVDVDAVADGVAADRKPDQQHRDRGDENGEKRVRRAVGEGDCTTDRLERQEGNGADRGVRDAARREAASALGGKAKRIILERLVRDPAIILPPDRDDALACGHAYYLAPLEAWLLNRHCRLRPRVWQALPSSNATAAPAGPASPRSWGGDHSPPAVRHSTYTGLRCSVG